MVTSPFHRYRRLGTGWTRALILLLLALAAHTVSAAGDPRTTSFVQAQAAYDEGDLSTAIRLFRAVEMQAPVHPALLFNLGNAYQRAGDNAKAVWYYRRAMRLAPRDFDIQANLKFALAEAGAPLPPATGAPWRWFLAVEQRIWLRLLRIAGALTAIALGAAALARRSRPAWRMLALLGGMALLPGAGGVLAWVQDLREPEAVVLTDGTPALFAPVEGHEMHFPLTGSSLVRIIRSERNWRLVREGSREGWVRADALAPITLPPGALADYTQELHP